METKDMIWKLRTKKGMSQEELATKTFVTRQAVSRWETGETVPNTEELKLLSKALDVSVNTLSRYPKALICQCCGMPLEDAVISREQDGAFNEEFCKWCYADGKFTYHSMDELIDFCATHMATEDYTEDMVRAYMQEFLPTLHYWKTYESIGGHDAVNEMEQKLMDEINDLQIDGMPKVEKLYQLKGDFVNLAYPLPSGASVSFLNDNATYLGAQLPCVFGGERCFGVVADVGFILVCTYEENGENPELVLYKKR
ncbi:MAG: helix-turn-helix domain-containing protein [Clostridia bacterium]|nr:helix-turn-helix domain-containing protein [Clostridia bacterium]